MIANLFCVNKPIIVNWANAIARINKKDSIANDSNTEATYFFLFYISYQNDSVYKNIFLKEHIFQT